VDGGTSRFDHNGVIYQAVCADCGGRSVFPASPRSYSNENRSFNCNMGLVKFDFSPLSSPLRLTVGPDSVCPGQAITISHNALNSNDFSLHALPEDDRIPYGNPVQYVPHGDSTTVTIRLTGTGPGCSSRDTLERVIRVLNRPNIRDTMALFCPGDTLTIRYPPRYQYIWSPSEGLEADTGYYQSIHDSREHAYSVIVRDRANSCTDTATVSLRNRKGSVRLIVQNETKPCDLVRTVVLRADTVFRPNAWHVNGNAYVNQDSIRLTYGYDSLNATIKSTGSCYMYDSLMAKIPLKRPLFDTTYTEQLHGKDCSRLRRQLALNGQPDTAYWILGDMQVAARQITLDAAARNLLLVQETAGCLDTTYVNLPDIGFRIPNVLTVNADGANDRLAIEHIDFESFRVYNHWGKRVFEQESPGDFKADPVLEWAPGAELPAGTYFFNIKLKNSTSCKGWIELVK
jgi:hypothetical protein